MLGTADVVPGGLETARPDLAIPLHPLPPPAESLRRALVSLRDPSFVRAGEITTRWAVATFIVLASSQLLPVPPSLRPWLVGTGTAMAAYLISRIALLAVSERWQRQYEPMWLSAQSEALRTHSFRVIRFTVRPDPRLHTEGRPGRHVVDLTDPGQVRDIRRLQATDEANGTQSRVIVEFVYRQEGRKNPAVERVKRYLKDVEFVPVHGSLTQSHAQFPEARYAARPSMTQRGQGRPGQTTYWLLGRPVSLTVRATESVVTS